MERICEGCGKRFRAHRAVRQQRYCSSEACQRTRKRRWQAWKRATDADYRSNQTAAQKAWCARNPSYWREYRRRKPGAADRNRERQRERNRERRGGKRRPLEAGGAEASASGPLITAGRYRMIPVGSGGDVIAKMDELFVELAVIPGLAAAGAG
ncbi:MAG: hypothetical protein ACREM1_06035 [Longimicrobiales bacterium]